LIDPSLGVGTLAIIGGVAGGIGDIAGQEIAKYGKNCKSINWGSAAGAVVGGAMAGWGTGVFSGLSEVFGEWGATSIGAAITAGPAIGLPAIGATLAGEGESSK
jgi:hypothetical protein